ncbi:sensor domain-containing protein [Demequina capsici]|uniref:histidine kinase n=1 Tax=Demequina capsici TaxID=3075620 RepID=A0AA96J9B8_9MICO|nr:sensor domain-containing protein [Demequina sp. PMTSA13]WNM27132.1 sensor domain-containing protein [Demequina sp. PMTSA13]
MDNETPQRPWIVQRAVQTGKDVAYLLTAFPIATASFVVAVTLATTSASLVIIWVGVPLGVATLWTMRGFAAFERVRLRLVRPERIEGVYTVAPAGSSGMRRLLHVFAVPQLWKDLVHAVVALPLATFTWSVTVSWVAMALGGVSAWIWEPFLPPEGVHPTEGFLYWINTTVAHVALGVIALATLPWVARGLALAHWWLGRGLLGTSDEARLRAEVERLESQRGAAASAESTSLRRIERDLHDGPQQRLVRLQMDAAAAERALDADPERARELLAAVREQSQETLAEIRALTRGFAPPLLAERGLAAAVRSLAERCPVPVTVSVTAAAPLGVATETAAYFVVSEALANVAKHAGARAAAVDISDSLGTLRVTVQDDGRGGASVAKGHGLAGLEDRLAGAGGTLTVTDADGGGTVVTATLPVG